MTYMYHLYRCAFPPSFYCSKRLHTQRQIGGVLNHNIRAKKKRKKKKTGGCCRAAANERRLPIGYALCSPITGALSLAVGIVAFTILCSCIATFTAAFFTSLCMLFINVYRLVTLSFGHVNIRNLQPLLIGSFWRNAKGSLHTRSKSAVLPSTHQSVARPSDGFTIHGASRQSNFYFSTDPTTDTHEWCEFGSWAVNQLRRCSGIVAKVPSEARRVSA